MNEHKTCNFFKCLNFLTFDIKNFSNKTKFIFLILFKEFLTSISFLYSYTEK